MHPNRATMIRVALEVMPFERTVPIRALDLGTGTSYFTQRFLARFPNSVVLAIDGAEAMVNVAKARLGSAAARVDFRIGDFRRLRQLTEGTSGIDVVFSSYALHHLDRVDKLAVVREAVGLLRPGGWFVNADIVRAQSHELEERFQALRVAGIVERARGRDGRFTDSATTRRFLDEMETNERDQPLTIGEDVEILRQSGLKSAEPFWMEYRELVSGGIA